MSTATAIQPRSALAGVTKGRRLGPRRIVVFGTEGIGKSSFGGGAPAPIFLATEDGTDHLDVSRFPKATSWEEVLANLKSLIDEEHAFKTLVLDTLDWMEPLIWAAICTRDGKTNIEDYGFGKGYVTALKEWQLFLSLLEKLQAKKGMHVILLAHAIKKTFKNPLGEDYDRYELKLHQKAADACREWASEVLFAAYEVLVDKNKKENKTRAFGQGRYLFTTKTAGYDAKNRSNLPERIRLGWADFEAAATSGMDPKALLAKLQERAQLAPDELKTKTLAYAETVKTDPQKLAATLARLDERLAELGAAPTQPTPQQAQ